MTKRKNKKQRNQLLYEPTAQSAFSCFPIKKHQKKARFSLGLFFFFFKNPTTPQKKKFSYSDIVPFITSCRLQPWHHSIVTDEEVHQLLLQLALDQRLRPRSCSWRRRQAVDFDGFLVHLLRPVVAALKYLQLLKGIARCFELLVTSCSFHMGVSN